MENAKPQWRVFEKLVAAIEKHLCPPEAIVVSPNRIRDKETGELREVDASIEYTVGSTPILITIECRDRSGIQDIIWIEQLSTKKRSIGAAVTIAVSSTDFTKPAKILAEKNGIEIRTLHDLSEEEIKSWEDQISPQLTFIEWFFTELQIEIDGSSPELVEKVLAMTNNEVVNNGYKAKLLKFEDGNLFPTLEEIGIKGIERNDYPDLPDIVVMFGAKFIDNPAYVHVDDQKIRVYGLNFSIQIKKKNIPIPILKLQQYSSVKAPILRIADSEIAFENWKINMKIISKI